MNGPGSQREVKEQGWVEIVSESSVSVGARSASEATKLDTGRSLRFLYIFPGLVPPELNRPRNKLTFLSRENLTGDVLLPVWWGDVEEVRRQLGDGGYPIYAFERFRYHLYPCPPHRRLQMPARFVFFLRRGLSIHRRTGYDAIVTYGTDLTGVAGLVLSRLTGARLIVELPGVPEVGTSIDEARPSWRSRGRHRISQLCLSLVAGSADRLKLLYPTQLDRYPRLARVPASVFHDFVPVHQIAARSADERFVLFLGFPWYLKGVDVLIRAFRRIAVDFPEHRLKIVGHIPDPAPLVELIGDCRQIELHRAVPHAEALTLVSRCSVLVLPSRSEGMGRVLLEAMAAARPVVASRVGGIPHYVRDGYNGFLFTSENDAELAEKLARLLRDPALARELGANGYRLVRTELDEDTYAREFAAMVRATCGDGSRPGSSPS